MIPEDACPTCNFNLGRYCFDADLGAGNEVTCPECGDRFALFEYSDGWESWFGFEPVEFDR